MNLPGGVFYSIKELHQLLSDTRAVARREGFQEGYKAHKQEQEHEMCLAHQGMCESGQYEHDAAIQRGE